MSASLREELKTRFGDDLSDEKVLRECEDICQKFGLTAEDFFFKAEAERINFVSGVRGSELTAINMETCSAIRQGLRRDQEASKTKKVQKTRGMMKPSLANVAMRGSGMHLIARARAGAPSTPTRPVKAEPATPEASIPKYPSYAGPSKVIYEGPRTSKRAYRYMYEKIYERSEVLDVRIDEFAAAIREHYGWDDLGDPSASTSDPIVVVGRIVPDVDAFSAEGSLKLTESSLALESSRYMGGGARVPLRFESNLKIRGAVGNKVGLFPGMIVALKGRNGGGGWFSVHEVISLPPLKKSTKPMDIKSDAFSIQVASGPYTLDEDLNYKHAKSFFQRLKSSRPSAVVLLGPFIDSNHPLLREGDVDCTPLELFQLKFLRPLQDYLNSEPGTMALLIPGTRDLLCKMAAYPQAEFPRSIVGNDDRIKLLPNPAHFRLNGVSFAATSLDVLFHVKKDELVKHGESVEDAPHSVQQTTSNPTGFISTSKNPVPAEEAIPPPKPEPEEVMKMEVDPQTAGPSAPFDGMASLCRHLLQQRSFYPVFPVPADLIQDLNLDVSHSDYLRIDAEKDDGGNGRGVAPDVLILPSRLKHFTKSLPLTTAINPSFLSKGTFATISIAGCSDKSVPIRERLDVMLERLET